MEVDDLSLRGIEAARRRVWLARAASAPIPAPRPPAYVPVSVGELDDAVAAALVRGRSSLEVLRMGKVHTTQIPEATSRRAPCAVCGLNIKQARLDAPICQHCADAPDSARAMLATRRAQAERRRDNAAETLLRAIDALDEADLARWHKICAWRLAAARVGRWEGVGEADAIARLERVKAAVHSGSDRVSAALRLVWLTDEEAHWIDAGAADALRRLDVAAEHLESVVAALVAFAA
jgi:hypothetical protein